MTTIPRYASDIRSAFSDIPEGQREMIRAVLHRMAARLDQEACNNGNQATQDRYRGLAARFTTYFLALGPNGYEAVASYHRGR